MSYQDDSLCEACQKEKQIKSSFKAKNVVSTSRPLDLLHIDLFGPTRTSSLSRCIYGLVIVYDYTRWTWVRFLTHKDESFDTFYKFCKKIQNKKEFVYLQSEVIMRESLKTIFLKKIVKRMVHHNFSILRTPQQIGVFER